MKRAQKDTKHAPVPEPQAKDLQMARGRAVLAGAGPAQRLQRHPGL